MTDRLAGAATGVGLPHRRSGDDIVGTKMLAVIVNYRTGALVVDCLHSLEAEVAALPGLRVVVVDNASGDASCATISAAIARNAWGGWASLVRSPVNGGFAHGNNRAIRAALACPDKPDIVWLLNPDTRVRPGAARALIGFLEDHPHAGIAGTALELEDGTLWPYAFRFPTILSEFERGARTGLVSRLLARHSVPRRMGSRPERVDWVPGASMVVRRALLERFGLMDEAYFLYYEETDFCLRAARAGWECWYVPQAVVTHIAGASTGVVDSMAANGRVPRYWFDSRRRYFVKSHGRLYAACADAAWAAAHLLWRVKCRIAREPATDAPSLLRDFCAAALTRSGSR